MPRTRGAVKLSAGGPALVPAPAPLPERATAASSSSSMASKRPPIRRASSAMPALPPTPPRTTHKRKRRSRSRVTDSSSEEEDEHEVPVVDSDGEDERVSGDPQRKVGALVIGHKRRRMLTLDAIAEELSEATAEDAFWMGEPGAGKLSGHAGAANSESKPRHKVVKNRGPSRARSRTRSPSSSPPPAPHLLRRGHTGLLSPPASRRAPAIVPRPATPPPEPAPSKEKGKAPEHPERDSPHNPFLVTDSPASGPPSDVLSSPEPRTPRKHVEPPTLTYVFRGVRTLMANPHYRSPGATEEAAAAEARARLPVNHPDFSPSDNCEPKLLFPEARRTRRRAHTVIEAPTSPTPRGTKRRSGSHSSSEEERVRTRASGSGKAKAPVAGPAAAVGAEEEDVTAMSAALAERVAKRMRKGIYADGEAPRTRPSSSASDELPRMPEKDRSDPIKRAMGPVRPR
ncbi:hypothetical protein ONZ51_g5403 [Trametes cubensis]|uniref:Uncharacterized protein n=1 Tax=Trametes cubensis TaxID=1111947 RepID=A0AAD7TWH2_9APHY|nr:hypothetical protein ONZ51_g5403 [Trametes cubensis]